MNIAGMNVDLMLDRRHSEIGLDRAEEAAVAQRHHQAAVNVTAKPCAAAGPSNTNGNANCDIAGVDLHNKTAAPSTSVMMEVGGQPDNVIRSYSNALNAHNHQIHYSLSSTSNGGCATNGTTPSSSSSSSIDLTALEENGVVKMDASNRDSPHLSCLTSPLVGDLPLVSMRSPPLPLELSMSDNVSSSLQSPSSASQSTTAKYPNVTQVALENYTSSSSSCDAISCSSLSPVASISAATSPTSSISTTTQQSLFQQAVLVDPRSPALLLQPALTAISPTASHLTEEDMEESGPFVCCWENCNQEFPILEALVSHLDKGHTISMDKYVCLWKDCARGKKPFDARYKLITHLRCHTGEKPYRCEYPTCTRSFSRLENLKLHVRTHTGEKPYECHYEGCTKKFNNTSDRAKHMKTHITRKPYVCRYPGCGKSYTDPSSMRKHIKYTHKKHEEGGGQERGLAHLSNGPPSRQGRKRDSCGSISGLSTSPSAPNTALTRFIHPHPSIPNAVAISHSINGQLLPALPSTAGSSANQNGGTGAVTLNASQVHQTQLIPVPLVQLPGGSPTTPAQSLSFLPGGGAVQTSPLFSPGGGPGPHHQQQQQQQLVMLLQPPTTTTGVANTATSGHEVVAVSSHNAAAIAKLHQQQNSAAKQQLALPPVQVLQQASSNGRLELQSAPLAIVNEEEKLRLQIAHLQQQLLQSQRAQLLAQQQVAQLQMKHQPGTEKKAAAGVARSVTEASVKLEGQVLPMDHTSSVSSPVCLSPSKIAIVTSSWPASSVAPPAIKSQNLITSPHSSSSSPPVARKTSGQIVLTSSILNPGQTTVLPTQLPVMLGQAAPQVIPIVQSPGVTQRQILYMAPSTS